MKLFLTCLLHVLCLSLLAQQNTLKAKYHVRSTFNIGEAGQANKTVSLDFEGVFAKKDNTFITYLKPLYTQKYPSGFVEVSSPGTGASRFPVPMDSLDRIKYVNMDSMVIRNHHASLVPNTPGNNTLFTFEKGCRVWHLLQEIKTINGLKCQKAILVSANSPVEVWFATEIPSESGPYGLLDLPGLVVEAWFPGINETWSLKEFVTGIELDKKLFWPDRFNSGFRFVNHLKRKDPLMVAN